MKPIANKQGLISGFLQSSRQFPESTALVVDDNRYTYRQLKQSATTIAATISNHAKSESKFGALLAYRSVHAYSAVLGLLASGRAYVPLSPKFPVDRNGYMLEQSASDVLVVGPECIDVLPDLLKHVKRPLIVVVAGAIPELVETDHPQHTVVRLDSRDPNMTTPEIKLEVEPDDPAYLLFTSGTTGHPKGIVVSHKNVNSYLDYTTARYKLDHHDRFSQAFDLTFDLSVHDLFVNWGVGGSLYVIPDVELVAPMKFIQRHGLTAWFSAPSTAMFMSKFKMLKPGAFPTLRSSLFCGEALPANLAEQWQSAAPNSIVENLYGPTEATIAISNYRWDSNTPDHCENGIVPIGHIFDTQECCVVDEQLNLVPPGTPGEFCLSGSQVTAGYLNDPQKTQRQFTKIPGRGEIIWYRTGDRVRRDERGCYHFLGRVDQQIKIRGFRVELLEVEEARRAAAGTEMAVAVAWPVKDGIALGIKAFIAGVDCGVESEVRRYCDERLPPYMVPDRFFFVETLPLNVNGKFDRKELAMQLASMNDA